MCPHPFPRDDEERIAPDDGGAVSVSAYVTGWHRSSGTSVVRELTAVASDRRNDNQRTMGDEHIDGPHRTEATERYAEFLADAPRWLHYEKARIHELSRTEVNRLARQELARRKSGGCIEDDPRAIWSWLFVEFTLYRTRDRDDAGGEAND